MGRRLDEDQNRRILENHPRNRDPLLLSAAQSVPSLTHPCGESESMYSQMAAGWLRHLSEGSVDVFSGGSNPADAINGVAVAAMAEVGIDIAGEQPKPWTDGEARAADVIVSMGCGDTCPVYPGKRYVDWDLADSAGQPIEVVREVRDDIGQRVRRLLASLNVATGS